MLFFMGSYMLGGERDRKEYRDSVVHHCGAVHCNELGMRWVQEVSTALEVIIICW